MNKIYLTLIFSLCLIFSCTNNNKIKDTPQNRISEANRYLSLMPSKEMIKELTQRMSSQFPTERRQIITDTISKQIDLEKITEISRESLVKNFTAEELKALADFYSSSIGRSVMKQFGQYMADISPQIQTMMFDAFKKANTEMKLKNAEPKNDPTSNCQSFHTQRSESASHQKVIC